MQSQQKQKINIISQTRVHTILAHSYVFFFLAFLIGLFLDFLFPLKVFNQLVAFPGGIIFLFLATVLIFWAQKTSRILKKENITKETFKHGPYFITRSPTHWGLTFLMLGFGILANAFFIVTFSIFAFLITKFVFLKKEEELLVKKYGTPYLEYQKSVKL